MEISLPAQAKLAVSLYRSAIIINNQNDALYVGIYAIKRRSVSNNSSNSATGKG